MFFAVPGRSDVTIVYQNESWLIYCVTWDFPVMLRNQKINILGSCLCCMRSKNKNCSYELRLMVVLRSSFKQQTGSLHVD